MPKDKNIVMLEGIVGTDAKFGKTQDGKEYFTFSLCINSYDKELADSTERTHSQTYCRIFIYDKKQLEYAKRVNIHGNSRVYVYGRLSSFKTERKGIEFMAMNVICRDIGLIRTKEQ